MVIGCDRDKHYYVRTSPGRIDDAIIEPQVMYLDNEPKITKYKTEHNEYPDGMEHISYCYLETDDGETVMVKSLIWYPNTREGYKHTEYWEMFAPVEEAMEGGEEQ